jgi:hypothetical protein
MLPAEYAKKVAAVKAVDEYVKVIKPGESFCHVVMLIGLTRYVAFFFSLHKCNKQRADVTYNLKLLVYGVQFILFGL